MNRPDDFGIVMAVRGVGRFTISDVKVGDPHGGLYENITINDITPSCLDLILWQRYYGRSNCRKTFRSLVKCNIYKPMAETPKHRPRG